MYIKFRDNLGVVLCYVDAYGIGFVDGKAYFSDGRREYTIPVGDLLEIISPEALPLQQ